METGLEVEPINAPFYKGQVRISEVFGPTIQGEGRYAGTPCYFIRTAGCDYKCAWCDSLHAVLPEEVRKVIPKDPQNVVEELRKLPGSAKLVVISGGNPALQDLTNLVLKLQSYGYTLTMETQGTVYKPWMNELEHITVSPKPPSAHLSPKQVNAQLPLLDAFINARVVRDNRLHMTYPTVDLKIPIFDELDLRFASVIAERYPEFMLYLSVGNDVGKDSTQDLIDKYHWLIDLVLRVPALSRARVLPQLHVLVWGNEKGK